jgi:hypothetical protein
MTHYLKDDSVLWPTAPGSYDVKESLPVGTYTVGQHPQRGFFLKRIDDFKFTGKIYGKTPTQADRILNTFASRPHSTGVLLSGEKGSGKTMLAKLVSEQGAAQGISTLIINTPFVGDAFNTFIQGINEPCIIVFDEFEKVFDAQEQEATLTLLDGVYPTKKLFILTCNDQYRVNQHMTNRPGRIFYFLDYKGLDLDFIEEYCNDVLINKVYVQQVCRLSMMYSTFNFDMLKALVEEMNRYNESPQSSLEMLNARPFSDEDRTMYNVTIAVDGVDMPDEHFQPRSVRGNPVGKNSLEFWVDDAPEDDNHRGDDLEITQHQLKKIDPIAGTFVYVVENTDPKRSTTVVTLTRAPEKAAYNWRNAI